MTDCDEIVIVMDNLSKKQKIKKRNTIVTNVTSAASINFHCKKVRPIFCIQFY